MQWIVAEKSFKKKLFENFGIEIIKDVISQEGDVQFVKNIFHDMACINKECL